MRHVIQFEHIRLKQQEIEVRALVALAKCGSNPQRYMACKKLEKIAYPEEIAKELAQEKIDDLL